MPPLQIEAEATLFRAFVAYGIDQDGVQELNSFAALLEEFLEAILYDGFAEGLDVSPTLRQAVVDQAGTLYDALP